MLNFDINVRCDAIFLRFGAAVLPFVFKNLIGRLCAFFSVLQFNAFIRHITRHFKVTFVEFRCVIRDVMLNFDINVRCDAIFLRFGAAVLPFVFKNLIGRLCAFFSVLQFNAFIRYITGHFKLTLVEFRGIVRNSMLNFDVNMCCDTVFLRFCVVVLPLVFKNLISRLCAFFSVL